MKEAEQARDYNERVSAVWRLSRAAAMYKGALQVLLLLLLLLLLLQLLLVALLTAVQGASMLAMSGCVVMGLWFVLPLSIS